MRLQVRWVIAFALIISMGVMYLSELWWIFLPGIFLLLIAAHDLYQTRHTILRNFPVLGHIRYALESIRPEINQYFIESNIDGTPINREKRSLVYQRAKNQRDTVPFGSRHDMYAPGFECVHHTLFPTQVNTKRLRTRIGGPDCRQPYDSSIFIISAMSFGALSSRAVEALNAGAAMGQFAHNSGEGGISEYHLKHDGDLIWQLGTGYFGCRTLAGDFDEEKFAATACMSQIKMIELKLSQGAKPGLGGLLPGKKVSFEIAQVRGVLPGLDVASPPRHKTFQNVRDMLVFVSRLRSLSQGKPIGIKLCVGRAEEIEQLCAAMVATQIMPDFISIDGAEGGTGAAPLEFTNHIGLPLTEALVLVHNTLNQYQIRQHIRLICSGKIISGFDIVRAMALGADICASARGMMMALGCIQALQCDSDRCPTGVATQDPNLVAGLVPEEKFKRVFNYHKKTVESVAAMMGAMGLTDSNEITADLISRRTTQGELIRLSEHYDVTRYRGKLEGKEHETIDQTSGHKNGTRA
ncbi:MAG TPA: FMN-binding glutamate synthase family protein [Oligoflexus sp.]|uniref:FMN-binding glutamate synthase family protein n=1 Tax=Oligoflexus sp. TaxID=1971216 RepID=UPI002D2D5859|nr:FMN-binding glutamate synthase family protein [Oligoflexus sp.]HYX34348.1 FMN-binding glutamate synthase family protein [Oligoflexus sp.]